MATQMIETFSEWNARVASDEYKDAFVEDVYGQLMRSELVLNLLRRQGLYDRLRGFLSSYWACRLARAVPDCFFR